MEGDHEGIFNRGDVSGGGLCRAGEGDDRGAALRARELYGAERLREALKGVNAPGASVVVGMLSSKEVAKFGLPEFWPQAKEAFLIRQVGGGAGEKTWVVTGSDASGILYGELELAARVKAAGQTAGGGSTLRIIRR